MKEKNLKIFKETTNALLIFILVLLSLNSYSQDTYVTFEDFDKFYIKSLEKYEYPQLSIDEITVLSDVNPINFPQFSGHLDVDLILLLYKIDEISDVAIYIKHEKLSINSGLIKKSVDVANFRLRFIEFLILKKIKSNE